MQNRTSIIVTARHQSMAGNLCFWVKPGTVGIVGVTV